MGRYKQPYSLTKRGKYYYYRTYTYDGKRTTCKTTGCTSKGAAKKYCDDLFLSGSLTNKSISFKDFSKDFFEENSPFVKDRNKPLSALTLRSYKSQLQLLVDDIGNIKLEDMTYIFLKNFRIKLMDKYEPSTIHIKMCILKIIVDYAFRTGIISNNPFMYLEKMHKETNQKDAFTLEEVKVIYTQIEPRLKPIVIALALTGMRISELYAVSDEYLIKEKDFTYYDLKFQNQEGKLVPPKYNSVRQIPMIQEIIDCFPLEPMTTFRAESLKIFKTLDNFTERKLSIHSLRHFFITNSKSYGIPSIKVEYLVGHKLKGIEQVYTNFKASDCLEILEWQKTILQKILQP